MTYVITLTVNWEKFKGGRKLLYLREQVIWDLFLCLLSLVLLSSLWKTITHNCWIALTCILLWERERTVVWNELLKIYQSLALDLDHCQFAHDQDFHKSFHQYIESVDVVVTRDMKGESSQNNFLPCPNSMMELFAKTVTNQKLFMTYSSFTATTINAEELIFLNKLNETSLYWMVHHLNGIKSLPFNVLTAFRKGVRSSCFYVSDESWTEFISNHDRNQLHQYPS